LIRFFLGKILSESNKQSPDAGTNKGERQEEEKKGSIHCRKKKKPPLQPLNAKGSFSRHFLPEVIRPFPHLQTRKKRR